MFAVAPTKPDRACTFTLDGTPLWGPHGVTAGRLGVGNVMQFSMAATDVIGKALQDVDRARKPEYQVFLEDNWVLILAVLVVVGVVVITRLLKR
mgnify:CR=1 FL=1